ncbi:MAG: ATP-dependent RecD-like DNA helicase, partial [Candidatus Latescibacteria bacterium]|nr:ATP-dependent RecD-like DNA helicase [Candidatus Latescibacterota bacterium]
KESLETIRGVVRVITFHNEENGFTIAKIEPKEGGKRLAVKGYIKQLSVGETVVLRGYWYNDPKWGPTFRFESYESVVPSSLEGIRCFLASKFMKGIGPVLAGKIVDTFGKDTVRVLDETPERLGEVPGLSRKNIDAVREGWESHRRIRDIMIFLQSHGISEAYASRIYEQYGADTVDALRSNPYRLIRDIRGIGFIKADQVASKLGLAEDAPDRVRAGILYCLDELVDKGHVHLPQDRLIEAAAETLGLDVDIVLGSVDYLKKQKLIEVDDDRVYPRDLYDREIEISQRLHLIAMTPRTVPPPKPGQIEALVEGIEHSRGIEFAEQQRRAIVTAAASKVMILTGGPGTGKTTTVLGIIDLLRRMRMQVLLCAPTGRAAKRMSEATGAEAKTIHRLLEYNPMRGSFAKNEGDPLGAHAVIMDEASMVDTTLMAEFLRAVSPYTSLVMVGDIDQLPSIGPGNVLRDTIDSGVVPTVRLTEIFRQAASSRIVTCAHRINRGQIPFTDNDRNGNFFFLSEREPAAIAATVVDTVSRRLPQRYGFDPIGDIQVLSPMHRSETGVQNLNSLLQDTLNPSRPSSPEILQSGWAFRVGDKVMQVRNNYDKLVFNGDIGRIARIDAKESKLFIRFDETVEYGLGELDEIVPAYAVSVHKSQGSEFRCVVVPVTTQHFIMLKRNLLYTAVTRARELVVLVGDYKALAIAVKNDQVSERLTSLRERLVDVFGKGSV